LTKRPELGYTEAYNNLGVICEKGVGGASKDETKAKQYFEKAAMEGCSNARNTLGCIAADAGSFDRAIKHWLIAASCGNLDAVNNIKKAMTIGHATMDHYSPALQGYQQYVNDVRSEQRDRAAAYSDEYKYLET
jgi:TPR repeat protein